MKSAAILILCALLGGCVAVPSSKVAYHDDKVTVTGHTVFIYPWFSDTYSYSVLSAFGQDYPDVRGSLPCYIEIPERNSILFVTGKEGHAVVHIVDLQTKKERSCPAYDSEIGTCILPKDQVTDTSYEKVESITEDTLVLSAATYKRRFKHQIDLKQPRYIRQESEFFDDFVEHKWVSSVYEGGVRPKA